MFTTANIDDRFPIKQKKFHDKIVGKIFRDKGYIGKDLFDSLFFLPKKPSIKIPNILPNKTIA